MKTSAQSSTHSSAQSSPARPAMHDPQLSPETLAKQIRYRDARATNTYDDIWQSVGKCVFCDLRDKYLFFEEHGVVMTVSLFAYIDGHFMIIPRRHVRSVKELSQLEWDTIRKFSYVAKKLIREVHGVKGMQLVQKDGSNAQSTVDQHLHFHCIPFDAPDLSVWNYRNLQFTPLENAALYRQARKKIVRAAAKYESEYRQPSGLPVVCDAVIINDRDEVLLQERSDRYTMLPPHDTLPGGHVDNFSRSFEEELAREVGEETGLEIAPEAFTLIASRTSTVTHVADSPHLNVRYGRTEQFVWNTYRLSGIPHTARLEPGDDTARLYWQPVKEAVTSSKLTPPLQDAIARAVSQTAL